ncbi:hypothetical protein D3C74_344290 [compost metagenome]
MNVGQACITQRENPFFCQQTGITVQLCIDAMCRTVRHDLQAILVFQGNFAPGQSHALKTRKLTNNTDDFLTTDARSIVPIVGAAIVAFIITVRCHSNFKPFQLIYAGCFEFE